MRAPHDPDSGWDYYVLAGVVSPGVATLSGHERVIGWDVKDASGQTGATSSRKGGPLGKFDADHYLVTDEDFAAWDAFQKLAESSTSTAEPVALEVVHPDLQRNHFTAVVLVSIGETRAEQDGGARIRITWQEHRPPKPKTVGSAKNAKSGGKETAGDKAIKDALDKIAALKAEGDKL